MRRFLFGCSLLSIIAICAQPPGQTVQSDVKKFVGKYCYDCHNADKDKGGVRLDNLADLINN